LADLKKEKLFAKEQVTRHTTAESDNSEDENNLENEKFNFLN
jgi:hypothetical protein